MSNELEFIEYLKRIKNQRGNLFEDRRINVFVRILKEDFPNKLNQIGENHLSLFEVEDIDYLQKLKKRCLQNGDLYSWNHSIGSMEPSSALLHYLNFLFEKNRKNFFWGYSLGIKTKNIMLYGSPGVGKTYNHKKLISMIENVDNEKNIFDTITNNKDYSILDGLDELFETIKKEKRIEFVTFHQSYSYEDFIEGFRPNENGNIKLEDGIFKKLCEEADKNPSKNFYIVIDEINRGNISKIFGELITLIEEDKRGKEEYRVKLPYSKKTFLVPSNLYIIATMNSTDKSIATIDIALRRRFTFLKMKPNLDLVENQEAKKLMEDLNKHISKTINEDYALGHSYFMNIKDDNDLEFVKEYKIKPLLEEYFYGDEDNYKKALKILGSEDELNKK
jgi:hypothetical protein